MKDVLQDIRILPAEIKDLSFIINLIIIDTQAGHYSAAIISKEGKFGLYNMLQCFIQGRSIELYGTYGKQIETGLVKIIRNSNTNIGFYILTNDNITKVTELKMFSILPNYRNKGFAKVIIGTIIQANNKVKALCFENSKVMLKTLLKLGFRVVEKTSKGSKRLEYQKNV